MKRYIRSNKYTTNSNKHILFDDTISITIDVDISFPISAATSSNFHRFPGLDQFKQDVLDILQDEYNFDVIEDVYDGVLQKFYHNHNSMMAFCQYAIISIVVVLLCSFTSYPTFEFLFNYLQ